MYKWYLFSVVFGLLLSCKTENKQDGELQSETLEKEIWEAVEERFYTWRDNDYNAHMATYHTDWRRWSLTTRKLLEKEDFAKLWDYVKNHEEVLKIVINPVDITILEQDKLAIAHFTSTETFRWIGPSQTSIFGSDMLKDSIYLGTLRWSDVLIKENGKWLCIGGHRDLSKLKNGLKLVATIKKRENSK